MTCTSSVHADAATHVEITPSILYVGTPVALLTTENADGSFNLAPMSSAWALGYTVVLGMGAASQTANNVVERPELVINFPSPELWSAVERLAPLTGRDPVPDPKRDRFRFERNKYAAAGLTASPSEVVRPPRVLECPIQLEARVEEARASAQGGVLILEARVLRVHAHPHLVLPGTQHVDPSRWSPLIYNFRHYFGLGAELGRSFRSETAPEIP